MLSLLEDILPTSSNATTLEGWVNRNLYILTCEVSGVLPIPEGIRWKSCMGEYNSNLHSKQLHYLLASMQGTRKAVLPVHNDRTFGIPWYIWTRLGLGYQSVE